VRTEERGTFTDGTKLTPHLVVTFVPRVRDERVLSLLPHRGSRGGSIQIVRSSRRPNRIGLQAHRVCPNLALFRHDGGVERCPLLEAKQKTSALSEYFAF
jgi:hypothetical protein